MSKLLVFIIISMTFAADLGYNDNEVYNCKKMANYTVAERREILQLYPIDKWVFTLISPIVFIYSIVLMGLFMMDTRLFGMPGDILFIITFSEFLKSIHLFSSGVYAVVKDYAPNPYGAFCQTNGIISTITFAMNTLYTLAFAAYPLVLFYNSLESTTKMMRVTNIMVTIFITVGLAVVASNDNNISLGLNGLCILSPDTKESEIVIDSGVLITLLCFVFMSIMFIVAFKKLVPKNSPMRSLRGRYLRYYQRFMVFTIIMRTLQIIFGGMNEINCYFFQNPYLNITITLQNITDIVIALGQCMIISSDPLLYNKFQKFMDRVYGRSAKTESIDDLKLDLDFGKDKSGIEMDILQELHVQMKKTQIYSILAAIQYLRFKNCENICQYVPEEGEQSSTSSLSFSESDVTKLSWCKKICFSKEDTEEVQQVTFTNDTIKQSVKFNPEMQSFDMKCTLYAPKIFHHFVTMDNIDLEDSFDLIKNNGKIAQFDGPDGGKSGEFFFFSHDNKLIIKTMRWSEVVSLRKRLILYANYLANFQQSLISKIYGVYTIQRVDSDSKTHILIMKNIALGIERKFIRRTFDMKGSEYDREVLAKSTRDPSQLTLKDTDFFKTEEKIFAVPDLNKSNILNYKDIHHQLKMDATLFKQLRLIDYSLLLMKIDWGASGIDVTKLINPLSYNIFESSKEKGVYYHIGIIDYLQEWNVNKNAERAAKKLITLNKDLDTSAQDPDTYADRFNQKLVERILPLE